MSDRPNLIDRLELRFSTGRTVDGLWIGTTEKQSELVLGRVGEALELVKTHDLRRYDRLRRDLARIWVRMLVGVRGCFSESTRACELDSRYVLSDQTTAADIASTIIHEATHARIHRAGIPYSQEFRHRIESACLRQQIAFAHRFPGGSVSRERAERWLSTPHNYWDDANLEELQVDGAVEGLQHLGVPSWIILGLRKLRPIGKLIRRFASGLTRA